MTNVDRTLCPSNIHQLAFSSAQRRHRILGRPPCRTCFQTLTSALYSLSTIYTWQRSISEIKIKKAIGTAMSGASLQLHGTSAAILEDIITWRTLIFWSSVGWQRLRPNTKKPSGLSAITGVPTARKQRMVSQLDICWHHNACMRHSTPDTRKMRAQGTELLPVWSDA